MPWICWAFDSRKKCRGNSGAFLTGYSACLTGYSLGFEVSQDVRFQYGGKTTN